MRPHILLWIVAAVIIGGVVAHFFPAIPKALGLP